MPVATHLEADCGGKRPVTERATLENRIPVGLVLKIACERLVARSRPPTEAQLHDHLRSAASPNREAIPTPRREG
jgi:hypothetical protein